MDAPSSITGCIAAIKRINARCRRLRKKDGPLAERLMAEKDRLIDAMGALCRHPSVVAMTGAKGRRICPRCGFCEGAMSGAPRVLVGRPTTHLAKDDYLVREGLVLKRLGINL